MVYGWDFGGQLDKKGPGQSRDEEHMWLCWMCWVAQRGKSGPAMGRCWCALQTKALGELVPTARSSTLDSQSEGRSWFCESRANFSSGKAAEGRVGRGPPSTQPAPCRGHMWALPWIITGNAACATCGSSKQYEWPGAAVQWASLRFIARWQCRPGLWPP